MSTSLESFEGFTDKEGILHRLYNDLLDMVLRWLEFFDLAHLVLCGNAQLTSRICDTCTMLDLPQNPLSCTPLLTSMVINMVNLRRLFMPSRCAHSLNGRDSEFDATRMLHDLIQSCNTSSAQCENNSCNFIRDSRLRPSSECVHRSGSSLSVIIIPALLVVQDLTCFIHLTGLVVAKITPSSDLRLPSTLIKLKIAMPIEDDAGTFMFSVCRDCQNLSELHFSLGVDASLDSTVKEGCTFPSMEKLNIVWYGEMNQHRIDSIHALFPAVSLLRILATFEDGWSERLLRDVPKYFSINLPWDFSAFSTVRIFQSPTALMAYPPNATDVTIPALWLRASEEPKVTTLPRFPPNLKSLALDDAVAFSSSSHPFDRVPTHGIIEHLPESCTRLVRNRDVWFTCDTTPQQDGLVEYKLLRETCLEAIRLPSPSTATRMDGVDLIQESPVQWRCFCEFVEEHRSRPSHMSCQVADQYYVSQPWSYLKNPFLAWPPFLRQLVSPDYRRHRHRLSSQQCQDIDVSSWSTDMSCIYLGHRRKIAMENGLAGNYAVTTPPNDQYDEFIEETVDSAHAVTWLPILCHLIPDYISSRFSLDQIPFQATAGKNEQIRIASAPYLACIRTILEAHCPLEPLLDSNRYRNVEHVCMVIVLLTSDVSLQEPYTDFLRANSTLNEIVSYLGTSEAAATLTNQLTLVTQTFGNELIRLSSKTLKNTVTRLRFNRVMKIIYKFTSGTFSSRAAEFYMRQLLQGHD